MKAFLCSLFAVLFVFASSVLAETDENQDQENQKFTISTHWEPTENCDCGEDAAKVKNISVGLIHQSPDSKNFKVDFGGMNRVSFQPKNFFYEPDKHQLRINQSSFVIEEAKNFISVAHAYNTKVDLLIAPESNYDPRLTPNSDVQITTGDILKLTDDIVALLKANDFDGVTLDLHQIFAKVERHKISTFSKFVANFISKIRGSDQLHKLQINFIVSDSDLLSRREWADFEQYKDHGGEGEFDRPDMGAKRLFLRLISESYTSNDDPLPLNRLMIRVDPPFAPVEKWTQCEMVQHPFKIQTSLRYDKKNRGLEFPPQNVLPLINLGVLKNDLNILENQYCQEKYMEEYVVWDSFEGLAFELFTTNKAWNDSYNLRMQSEMQVAKQWSDLSSIRRIPKNINASKITKVICDFFCPHQNLVTLINIALLAVSILIIILSAFVYRVFAMFHSTIRILIFVGIVFTLLLTFFALIQCEPDLAGYRMEVFGAVIVAFLLRPALWLFKRYQREGYP